MNAHKGGGRQVVQICIAAGMPGKHKKRLQAGLDPRMYYQTTSVLKAKDSEPERALPHADVLTASACSHAPLLVRALLALDAHGAVRLTLLSTPTEGSGRAEQAPALASSCDGSATAAAAFLPSSVSAAMDRVPPAASSAPASPRSAPFGATAAAAAAAAISAVVDADAGLPPPAPLPLPPSTSPAATGRDDDIFALDEELGAPPPPIARGALDASERSDCADDESGVASTAVSLHPPAVDGVSSSGSNVGGTCMANWAGLARGSEPIAVSGSLPAHLADVRLGKSSTPGRGSGWSVGSFNSRPSGLFDGLDESECSDGLRLAARRERALGTGATDVAGSPPPRLASSAPAAWPAIAVSPTEAAAAAEAAAVEAAAAAAAACDGDSEDEGVMCAICHGSIQPQEAALVRGCDHPFCVDCILNWALQKPKCPLCNMAFTHLWTYRMLDGTYNDFLAEEHVEMLQATKWFKKKVASDFTPRAAHPGDDEDDEYLEQLQYQFGGALDEEEERAYFDDMEEGLIARRGGGGRRAFGNRPWGAGGMVMNGRLQARPPGIPRTPRTPVLPSAKSTKGFGVKGSSAAGASSGDYCLTPERHASDGSIGSTGSGSGSKGKSAMKKAEKALEKEAAKERRREIAQGSRGLSK